MPAFHFRAVSPAFSALNVSRLVGVSLFEKDPSRALHVQDSIVSRLESKLKAPKKKT